MSKYPRDRLTIRKIAMFPVWILSNLWFALKCAIGWPLLFGLNPAECGLGFLGVEIGLGFLVFLLERMQSNMHLKQIFPDWIHYLALNWVALGIVCICYGIWLLYEKHYYREG